ncbi:MAG: glycosyltransferase [Bacteroidales bacterium]
MKRISLYLDKFYYLIFLLLLKLSFLFIKLISVLVSHSSSKKIQGDIILFPYAFVGSDGYLRRFLEYLPFCEKSNISYKLCPLFTDAYARKQLKRGRFFQYLFYLRILWKRIPQVLQARYYRAVFIQRGLFPVYFDLKNPQLEKMLRKLNSNITIDIWDSIFERQPVLVSRTIQYADKLSLSNEFLMGHFNNFSGERILWKIAVNLNKYKVKQDYSITGKARLFWTGLPHNLPNLEKFLPVLKEISDTHPLILVLACQQPLQYKGLEIENHPWDESTFFDLLLHSDIGIYPEFNSVVSKGKSTMKVMDYLSTALPAVGVPYGLPAEVEHGRELMIAESFEEWKDMLVLLLKDEALRRTLGRNGRLMVEKHYSLEASFEQFRNFIFNPEA